MKEKMKYLNWLIKEIMASFGGGIVTLALMSYLLGDGVAQFLLLAAFSVIVKDVFMTDRWIKNMSVFLRKTLYFFVIILGVFIMSRLFKWFPADATRAWIFFGAFFAVAMVIMTILTRTREISENNKLQEALEKYKKREKK